MIERSFHLSTRRLGLSRWSGEDLPLAQLLWSDPAVMRLLGGPLSAAGAQERLALEQAHDDRFGVQYWPVFLLDAPGTFVGCAGLRPYPSAGSPEAEPGVWEMGAHLRPQFWGEGIAAEAGAAILRYAFGGLGATAVVAAHHPDNLASSRLIERLGFGYERHCLYPPTGLEHPYYRLTAGRYRAEEHSVAN